MVRISAGSPRTFLPPTLLGIVANSGVADETAAPIARNPLELPRLITPTPAEGFQLALKLSRLGVPQTQHDREVLKSGRPRYATDPALLIQASQTVAIHFRTVAQANDFWRGSAR